MKQHVSIWRKITLIGTSVALVFIGGGLLWASTVKLPDISNFEARKIANSSKITDRTGEIVLYDIHQSVRRTEIPLTQMGDPIQKAVISIEDSHFYEHHGIRPTSIIRAVFVNLFSGSFSQGGSTLTQQIIKNTLLNSDKTVVRKLKEWVLAVKLEREFTKDQILQIYLNDAPFGSTIYGVEEASRSFFGIHANQLSIAQSAYLAAMIPAPSYYSPFGRHVDKLTERKDLVLTKMKSYGYITQTQYDQAKTEKVTFSANASNSIKAPHFVFYILDQLEQRYGKDVMESGGLTIKTTLDYELQQKAEELVAQYAKDNKTKFNASNAGLVTIDPTTGQILTMVGSRNYFDKEIDGAYNIATAQRQPGSSFKPFVYLSAFEKGYTPETVLFDVPTEFSTNCSADQRPLPGFTDKDCYNPQNFDGKYRGPISLRSAIAESRNVPSVKLLYLVGVQNAVDLAHQLGITTLNDPKELGLSLVLGGGEVTLLDMTSAYSVFANSGVRNPVTGIVEVTDSSGKTLEQFEPTPTQVTDKNAVLTLNDVLSDAQARIPTFGSSITIPGVAVKTGTTNSDRDAWIIGYTPTLTVGVWSGNNDNTPMRSGGAAVSGPLLKAFLAEALKKFPVTPFEKPVPDPNYQNLKPILRGIWMGNQVVVLDKVTGLRATDQTPPESRVEKVITDVEDILYWINKDNPQGPAPTNPNNDPQFHLWNPPVQAWWESNKSHYPNVTSADVPVGYDTVHTNQNGPVLTISGLPTQFQTNKTVLIKINAASQFSLTSVDLYVNDNYLTTLSSPFTFSFNPHDYGFQPGSYTLKATGTTTIYTKSSIEQPFTLN